MKKNYRVSLWNVLLLMGAIVFLSGCPQANEPSGGGEQQGEIKSEELKGVWEFAVLGTPPTPAAVFTSPAFWSCKRIFLIITALTPVLSAIKSEVTR